MGQIFFPLTSLIAGPVAFPADEALPPSFQGLLPFGGAQAASGPGPNLSPLLEH